MDNGKLAFNSPSFGLLSLDEIRQRVLEFMRVLPEHKYQLVIGTDSQPKNGQGCDFVTAIVVHRTGMGGIYFWKRKVEEKKLVLRSRIYQEAVLSLQTAEELLTVFKNDGITKYDVEIHVDIGNHGKTREMLSEIIGMIRGSGYIVKTKPDSYGASKVADRHT
jgi:predicted RNase H-related nuclease YkuK (DUF458 family)